MACKIYPKIDTLYTRDEKFKITDEIRRPEFLVPREWLVTEKIHGCNIRISLEQESCAHVVNGLDCLGLSYCDMPWTMQINGRNDNSQIPPNLLRHLQGAFTLDGLRSLWRCKSSCRCLGEGVIAVEDGPIRECGNKASQPLAIEPCPNVEPYSITLYGEGYGGGIQKGGGEYTSKAKGGAVNFRLFDVLVGETWLRRADVEDVAAKLGIQTVPLLGDGFTLSLIDQLVRDGLGSTVAAIEGAEGHKAEGVVAFTAEPLYNNRGQRLMFKLKAEDFS